MFWHDLSTSMIKVWLMRTLMILGLMVGLFILSLPGDETLINKGKVELNETIEAQLNLDACYSSIGISGSNFVIRDQESFENLEWVFQPNEHCQITELPEIDFEQYTLLGQTTDLECSNTISRKVTQKENGQWLYQIILQDDRSCDGFQLNRNWVLIPRLDLDEEVDFNIITLGNTIAGA